MNLGFVFQEMWAGLRSNLAMAFSIVLVTFISMTFVGVAALLQLQITEMKNFWFDRAQVVVYLCTEYSSELACPSGAVSQDQKDRVALQLGSSSLDPYVANFYFESHQEAYEKFTEEFADSSAIAFISAEQLNEAYWVNLVDPERSDLIVESLSGMPGVEEVRDQRGYLDQIFLFLNIGSLAAAGIASVMLLSATLLISTTIRLSAFSRRREIGIMRLVGASKFSIQLPFVLEGIIAASLGSGLAIAGNYFIVDTLVGEYLAPQLPFTSFIGASQAIEIAPLILLGGVILATLASGVSIRRYLKT
ncbi:MAG: permease-like cell division protein FtsX [Aquiluna sp.]|nr:permease-like cell division protein FtsX [Aquiluna sp.]